jgi:hypothetical protein
LGADDLYASGSPDTIAIQINMNDVFESFATTLVTEAFSATQWRVLSQRSENSVVRHRSTGKRYSSIIPDLVLTDGHQRIPFDCKYKLYGRSGAKISSGDIYQTFLYAFSHGDDRNQSPRVGIIYPAIAKPSTIGDIRDDMPSPKVGGSIGIGLNYKPFTIDFSIYGDPVESYLEQDLRISSVVSITMNL